MFISTWLEQHIVLFIYCTCDLFEKNKNKIFRADGLAQPHLRPNEEHAFYNSKDENPVLS